MHIKLWLLSAATATLLLGCASQESTPETAPIQELSPVVTFDQAESAVSDQPLVEELVPQEPVFTLETVTHSDSVYVPEDDTVLLARYDYYLPYLSVNDPANLDAVAIAEAFNAQFSMWEDSNDFAQTAVYAYSDYQFTLEQGQTWSTHYQTELSTYIYQTSGYISLEGLYYSFTGGAHPNTVLLSWLFDLTTGTFVSPLTLAKDPQMFADAVAQELIAQVQTGTLDGIALEDLYWDDYQTVLSSWDSYCVYFNEDGMQIGFSPYELAAYAAGAQTFTIPYSMITPYLSDQALAMLDLA